jgi:acetyltransferase-like isoleucine patch superfamily enzyme
VSINQPIVSRIQRQGDWLLHDLRRGLRDFLINTLAGSPLTPRALRHAVYRLVGMHVETPGIMHSCVFEGSAGNIVIGHSSFINTHCFLEAVASVRIGAQCGLAMHVMIVTSGHALAPDGHWTQQRTAEPVTLGDHVWVGARSIILPGVTVGEHCVIAAGSVVIRDCDAWGLYAGVPARKVRDLRGAVPPT